MSRKSLYERKQKENQPVLAICYDFDKTLTEDDMQAQGFIQSIGYDVPAFWEKTNSMAENADMDQNLSWMYAMITESRGKEYITKRSLEEYGSRVKLFPGVESWFDRINKYGNEKGIKVEHYIISSGLLEMIEGTTIGKKKVFEKIYASSFFFGENGDAVWPAQVVNYTNKTQYLFRIEKGTLDVNDQGVNDYFEESQKRIPFRNIIYIGDSATDIPCMKLVNSKGGHSIGVFNPETVNNDSVHRLLRENRIKYYAPASYEEGEKLDVLIKAIIDRTAENEKLERIHLNCVEEAHKSIIDADTIAQQRRESLIQALRSSYSFANTHMVIHDMDKIEDSEWSQEDIVELCRIAWCNSQVNYILTDDDVATFYNRLIKRSKKSDANIEFVRGELS